MSNWATEYIKQLQSGKTVKFRPRGHSMKGKVNDGQLVTVEPVKELSSIRIGDVVLCHVVGKDYLHLVVDDHDGVRDRFLIGNMKGFTNGWTNKIYGKVIKVEK